jgi:hypothetical protein
MADSSGRGPTKPLYRVDGQLTDQKPPEAEGRAIGAAEVHGRDGRYVVTMGPARSRPAFPRRPLDPTCLEPSDLPADQKAEVVRLVRLVQTDFDPEIDPRGWDSVAEIVRGVHPADVVRQMDYPALAAFFRVRHGQIRHQLGGAIETTTPSIVSLKADLGAKPATKTRGETAAERLWQLWRDRDGKRKILAAGSAVEIAFLIGKSKTQVVEAGRIWDDEIKPALAAQRSMVRVHREEERLDR